MERRGEIIQLWVTPEEKQIAKRRAKETKAESVATYIRQLILKDSGLDAEKGRREGRR